MTRAARAELRRARTVKATTRLAARHRRSALLTLWWARDASVDRHAWNAAERARTATRYERAMMAWHDAAA